MYSGISDKVRDKRTKYTDQEVIENARTFTTRKEWREQCPQYVATARRRGILEVCVEHMTNLKRGRKKQIEWTMEELEKDALNYVTRTAWMRSSPTAYNKARTLGIINEIAPHMPKRVPSRKPFWNDESCLENARQFKTRRGWQFSPGTSYHYAVRRKIVHLCVEHMISHEPKSENDTWYVHEIKSDAMQYNTISEWRDKSPAYDEALQRDILDKCTAHMVDAKKEDSKLNWSLKRCTFDALEYWTLAEWKKKKYNIYQHAKRNGWLDKCCEHMTDYEK